MLALSCPIVRFHASGFNNGPRLGPQSSSRIQTLTVTSSSRIFSARFPANVFQDASRVVARTSWRSTRIESMEPASSSHAAAECAARFGISSKAYRGIPSSCAGPPSLGILAQRQICLCDPLKSSDLSLRVRKKILQREMIPRGYEMGSWRRDRALDL